MRLEHVERDLAWVREEKARLTRMEAHLLGLMDLIKNGKPFPSKKTSTSDTTAVRETVQYFKGNLFTSEQIFDDLKENSLLYGEIPRSHVSAILGRMVKTGDIAVVTLGRGRSPSIYRRDGLQPPSPSPSEK